MFTTKFQLALGLWVLDLGVEVPVNVRFCHCVHTFHPAPNANFRPQLHSHNPLPVLPTVDTTLRVRVCRWVDGGGCILLKVPSTFFFNKVHSFKKSLCTIEFMLLCPQQA